MEFEDKSMRDPCKEVSLSTIANPTVEMEEEELYNIFHELRPSVYKAHVVSLYSPVL